MTTPDLSALVPLKYKALVGLVSNLLTLGVPWVLSVSDALPAPWPLVVGGVIAILGAVGVYKVPYLPSNTAVVPEVVAQSAPPVAGEYQPTWQKP